MRPAPGMATRALVVLPCLAGVARREEAQRLILRGTPRDAAELRRRLSALSKLLPAGPAGRVGALIATLPAEGDPDWDALLEATTPRAPAMAMGERRLGAVTVLPEGQVPWRTGAPADRDGRRGRPLPRDAARIGPVRGSRARPRARALRARLAHAGRDAGDLARALPAAALVGAGRHRGAGPTAGSGGRPSAREHGDLASGACPGPRGGAAGARRGLRPLRLALRLAPHPPHRGRRTAGPRAGVARPRRRPSGAARGRRGAAQAPVAVAARDLDGLAAPLGPARAGRRGSKLGPRRGRGDGEGHDPPRRPREAVPAGSRHPTPR